ncbi:hypothetical protein LSTR_LSTR000840 [Laodelphax striatellus]|uniref:START domain-containing protein 10 n=1 Tax=Laodelphax striatellus TaxID=195883 RepID=A0A482X0I6_LAOST|nr:hypothetical protein LSTR_LSTR000840 [Laodelphax striatellus]
MDVGVIKVAEDKDFENLKVLIDNHNGWNLDYDKSTIKVWTKNLEGTNFKMLKIKALFSEIDPEVIYDVLHDPEYRKVWDQHMIEAKDIGCLNPNNDVGYYSMSCPPPLRNRDFVLQRSWLDLGNEKYILNHSVNHRSYPPREGFVRGTSHLTGYLVRCSTTKGTDFGYISQTDPQGTLPTWLVNKVTQIFGPKMVKNLQKATVGYTEWKQQNNPNWKPWHYPEQITSPRLQIQDCTLTQEELKICENKADPANKKKKKIKKGAM